MDYLVTGSAIVNNLRFHDGRKVDNVLGGCAIYALTGIRTFTKDCVVALKVGEDFDQYYGEWFQKNGLSKDGLVVVDKHTLNSYLVYGEDGAYIDRSVWLDDSATTPFHSDVFNHDLDAFAHLYPEVKKCVYAFNDCTKLVPYKEQYGFKVMYEVENNAGAEDRDTFYKSYEVCDFFSLNRRESFGIFGVDTIEDALKKLVELEKPCFYRVGHKGSYLTMDGKAWYVPQIQVVPPDQEVDPTGCGNSSSAAATWALLEGYDPTMVCCIANATAGFNVLQYGPIPAMNLRVKNGVMSFANMIYEEVKDNSRVI